MQRFRGALVSKAHRLVYHSTLGLRAITKKTKVEDFKQGLHRLCVQRVQSIVSRGFDFLENFLETRATTLKSEIQNSKSTSLET
jgi:hypothetical protein